MRILHCLRAPVGGLFRHVLDLAAEQARLGHDVGILADSTAENALTATQFRTIAPAMRLGVVRIPMRRQPGIGDMAAVSAVVKHARGLDLDVLHGHGAKGGAYARLAARALKRGDNAVKAFYTPHGGSLHYDPGSLAGRVLLTIERQLESLASGIIFESTYAAKTYADRIGPLRVPFRAVHNGLAPADFEPVVPVAGATDLLFVGELRELKGVHILIDAIAALAKTRSVTATVVGAGQSEAALKAQVERNGLSRQVTFAGAMPARAAFKLGNVMVVPSLAESLPYIVLEAAAAELPLIATNVGGIPEIVSGTDTALVEAGSVAALTAAIGEALADPARSAARAGRLRAHVGEAFTVEAMAAAVLDFYQVTNR